MTVHINMLDPQRVPMADMTDARAVIREVIARLFWYMRDSHGVAVSEEQIAQVRGAPVAAIAMGAIKMGEKLAALETGGPAAMAALWREMCAGIGESIVVSDAVFEDTRLLAYTDMIHGNVVALCAV